MMVARNQFFIVMISSSFVIQCQVSLVVHTEQGCGREMSREGVEGLIVASQYAWPVGGLSCMKSCPTSLSTYSTVTI